MLKFTLYQHRGYLNNENLDTATGAHNNLPLSEYFGKSQEE